MGVLLGLQGRERADSAITELHGDVAQESIFGGQPWRHLLHRHVTQLFRRLAASPRIDSRDHVRHGVFSPLFPSLSWRAHDLPPAGLSLSRQNTVVPDVPQ